MKAQHIENALGGTMPFIFLVGCIASLGADIASANETEVAQGEERIYLVVEDGQLISHPFLAFITEEITFKMNPRLVLRGSNFAMPKEDFEDKPIEPTDVATGQFRTVEIDPEVGPLPRSGTLLVFDLSGYSIPPYKSGVRVLPSLEWHEPSVNGEPSAKRVAIAEKEIYLGNIVGGALWTSLALIAVLAVLLRWSVLKSKQVSAFQPRPMLFLITGPDGYLSLWRTQLMMWTFAVGGIVFLYGMLRLRIPEIPETLVALMGLSLATGGLSAKQARKDQKKKEEQNKTKNTSSAPPDSQAPAAENGSVEGSSADLISTWNEVKQQVELSVPKAQMVVWTVLILTLFIVKSILEGKLWEVPWQMVALTGASQAGYIGEKYVRSAVPVGRS